MEVCNNFHYPFLLRGRKPACRTKPVKGLIQIKKAPKPKSSEKKRKLQSYCGSDDDQNFKKRRISSISDCDCATVNDYECLGKISQGSYGAVYKVREKRTGEILAVKEELQGLSPSTLMEIDLLKSLGHHPSIVGFKKVAVDDGDGVYVVMEFMESDLRRYINGKKEGFEIAEVKGLMKQLVEGVKFLHDNKVMHRDLKTSNVLVNSDGELKICDFGLSTRFKEGGMAENENGGVGTVGYRAPEVMEGAERYSCAVDMWAVGCIMAELVLKKPLFQGKNECDMLLQIYRILGLPDEDIPPGFGFGFRHDDDDDLSCSSSLRDMFESADCELTEAAFDLLGKLLSSDPRKRITADDALCHVWFQE